MDVIAKDLSHHYGGKELSLFLYVNNTQIQPTLLALPTVEHLASRGLPFRGTEDKFGSPRSGNYVMALKLIAEFDPFLTENIKLHGNKGSGTTAYISSFVCEEFIHIIGNNVVYEIVNKGKLAKYFSNSVDSTPDVAYSDQLTFIIRYVSENCLPEEDFLKFIPSCGHKGEDMVTAILDVLAEYDLDVKNCRGQSYENASKMSGLYSGVQARILVLVSLVVYVPCAPHSLNIVGTNTVKSSSMPQSSVVKNLSKTRWSDQADACKSVCQSWNEILNALSHIANDECQKPDTRQEALDLHNSLNSLDNCLIDLLWNDILEGFRVVSKALQAQDCHIILVVELYQNLITYVTNNGTEFDSYDEKAKNMCKQTSYKQDNSRKRLRKSHFEETTGTELVVELQRRCKAYELLQDRFAFLTLLQTKKSDEIKKDCQKFFSTYPNDLGEVLKSECLHLSAHLKTLRIEKVSATNLSAMFSEKGLMVVYPNFNIALRM
ncbi:uncharacterized protein LOC117181237 [Belonocnema kinseyi]|uniref:uncharacterized protein LOC117181237 n=1 Tax=Belonocnema kinseyi TaxID=2817044 RepID=UPI00143DB085|nr:uncharacterized protein LOC117181237 [Belonocnema kinseyi]